MHAVASIQVTVGLPLRRQLEPGDRGRQIGHAADESIDGAAEERRVSSADVNSNMRDMAARRRGEQ